MNGGGCFFTASLLGGWLLFRFVEMPAMRRFGRAKPRTRPAPDPAGAPYEGPGPQQGQDQAPVPAAAGGGHRTT